MVTDIYRINRQCRKCREGWLLIDYHTFMGRIEITDCVCYVCGWRDYSIEGRVFNQYGNQLVRYKGTSIPMGGIDDD